MFGMRWIFAEQHSAIARWGGRSRWPNGFAIPCRGVRHVIFGFAWTVRTASCAGRTFRSRGDATVAGFAGIAACRWSSFRRPATPCASCPASSRPDGMNQTQRRRELLVFRAAAPKAAAPRGGSVRSSARHSRQSSDPCPWAQVGSHGEPSKRTFDIAGRRETLRPSKPVIGRKRLLGSRHRRAAFSKPRSSYFLAATARTLALTPVRRPGWVGWTSWAGRVSPRGGSTTARQFAGGTADVANGVGWRSLLPDGRISRSFGECRPGGYLT